MRTLSILLLLPACGLAATNCDGLAQLSLPDTKITLAQLPWEQGTYTWRVAPYWTDSSNRYSWQQICLLHTGGTFEKQYTGSYPATALPTAAPTPTATPTEWIPS